MAFFFQWSQSVTFFFFFFFFPVTIFVYSEQHWKISTKNVDRRDLKVNIFVAGEFAWLRRKESVIRSLLEFSYTSFWGPGNAFLIFLIVWEVLLQLNPLIITVVLW